MSDGHLPSSFDGDSRYREETVWQTVTRRVKEDPLVILGCGLTFGAFYGALRAVRRRDSEKAQIMFRRRLYAQSFTLVAVVAGSFYFKEDRSRRKEFEGKLAENKAQEKRDKWIRELEARDQEDKAWKAKMDALAAGARVPAERKVPAALTSKDASGKE